jgi:hypothetical protein
VKAAEKPDFTMLLERPPPSESTHLLAVYIASDTEIGSSGDVVETSQSPSSELGKAATVSQVLPG